MGLGLRRGMAVQVAGAVGREELAAVQADQAEDPGQGGGDRGAGKEANKDRSGLAAMQLQHHGTNRPRLSHPRDTQPWGLVQQGSDKDLIKELLRKSGVLVGD